MTRSKTNWGLPKPIIPLITLLVIIGVVAGLGHPALAQQYGPTYGPTSVPIPPTTWTISWNLTDARLEYGVTPSGLANLIYGYLISNMTPWYFTAGKTFTIYIANASDVYYWNGTGFQLFSPVMMHATATANSTGGITWTVTTPFSNVLPSQVYANWTVVVVLDNYGGANWLVFNVTSTFMDLADLMNNLTTVSTASYIPVSPSIAKYLIPKVTTTVTYTPPSETPITAYKYPLFRPVNGSETTSSDLYVVLPDLYFFFLYVGASANASIPLEPLSSASQLEASVTLGTGVTVFGPTTYNSTVSALFNGEYTGFGPIYYVTNEFSGLNSADNNYPSVKAQPIVITVSYVYPSGQSVVLFNYTTATTNNYTTPESFNVAVAYNWTVGAVALTALDNASNTSPALFIGIPVVEFLIGSVYDLKGNPIIYSATNIPNPILAQKLYVKWLLKTTPVATVVSENYLEYYETTAALVPIGYFSGTGPGAPSFQSSSFPTPELYIFYENQPVFTATISVAQSFLKGPLTPVTINNIYVALMPVFINITQFSSTVSASQQLPLSPDQVPYVTIYYAFSSTGPIISQTPPTGAVSGMLYYEEQVSATTQLGATPTTFPATIAQFPPFEQSSISGVLVTPEVNWFPAPPLNASISVGQQTKLTITVKSPQYYYYSFWLMYNGVTVGYGVYELGYEPGSLKNNGVTVPWMPMFDVYPISESNTTLLSFYDNSTTEPYIRTPTGVHINATGYGMLQYENVLSEVAYIAATYTVFNVQFLNLCNETLTGGVVSITEKTPSGATATLPPVTLSPTAYVLKITAPVALEISSVSGAPYIEMLSPTFNFTLNYYGYVMPSVNYTSRQPEYNYVLTPGVISIVYFPLIDINVQVLSNTTPAYPLWGFAVNMYSAVTGQKMWEAITNSSGYAYVMNVPLNASYIKPVSYVVLKVRTISPATDSAYSYAKVLSDYGQTYQAYATALGLSPNSYVYTLGTRGPFDEDLTVYYNAQFSIPVTTTCGQVFPLTVAVETLKIYVTDLEGNVLSSQPVYPCATPSYCPSFYYNVTLVIDDQYSPYYLASQWQSFPTLYLNLTDFRVVGQTWMQPIYKSLESTFESLLSTTQSAYQSGSITQQQYFAWYVGNYSYYALAALLANYSTASPYAVFSFPSIPPHEGTIFVRLFMPGQVFPMKVYYLGQEVFNNLVPVPQPNEIAVVTPTGQVQYVTSYTVYEGGKAVSVPPGSIVIEASVYPVKFNITSKSGLYPVGNTYLGLTFTDVLYREYVMPGSNLYSDEVQQYISDILYPFNVAGSGILTPNELYVYLNGTKNISESVSRTPVPVPAPTPELIDNLYSMAGYVLPDLMGFYVNSRIPTTSLTPLYMSSISPNVFDEATMPNDVYFNLTMGIPIYATAAGQLVTALPADSMLYVGTTGYSEFRLLVNETYLTPSILLLNSTSTPVQYSHIAPGQLATNYYFEEIPNGPAPIPAIYITQNTYSILGFNYTLSPNLISYRLWEAYINATGMTSITNATIGIYAANVTSTGKVTWYYVYSINETSLFQEAMTRTVPLYLPLNITLIETKVEGKITGLAVILYVYGSGTYYVLPPATESDHVHVLTPVLSTGFGGYVKHYEAPLYTYYNSTNSTDITGYLPFTYPTPNSEWFPYFGSPLTVVIPVPSSGEAVFDMPWWAPTTGAYGTRIARFWVMGTTSTPNIGYGSIKAVYTPSQYTPTAPSPLPQLAISSYVLLNYITPKYGAKAVYTGEIPPGVVVSGSAPQQIGPQQFQIRVPNGNMTAIGAGTGGTSAPMLLVDTLFPEDLWNVTLSTMPANGVYNIRTVALESVEVYNNASFPIFIVGFKYSSAGKTFPISIPTVELPEGAIVDIPVKYIYGSSYEFASTWCDNGSYAPYIPDLSATVYYVPPNATFYLANGTALPFTVYPNGTVSIGPYTYNISQLEATLTSPPINFTTLYAGSELDNVNMTVVIPLYPPYYSSSSSITGAQHVFYDDLPYPIPAPTFYATINMPFASGVWWDVSGYVGIPSAPDLLPSASNDTEAKLVFTYPTIPLAAIEDWDGRPLPNQMVVAYGTSTSPWLCAGTGAVAIDFSNAYGQLMQPLPANNRTVVYWYDSCLLYKITNGAYPYINIYDTNITTDVQTLGNAFSSTAVETHVVPATIYLKSATGTGIPGALVVVFDQPTTGNELLAFNVTGTDGSITPVDYRIYPPATSQLPPTNYYVVAYYAANGTPLTWQEIQQAISSSSSHSVTLQLVPVFENTFSIQRTVTATEAIESFTLSNILTTANIVVVLSSFGPAPGVTLSYSVSEPECPVTITQASPASTIVGYTYSVTPLMPSPSVCTSTTAVTGTGTTNAQGQLTTATFVTPIAPFAAQVTVSVQSWKGIPLGYTYTYYVTSSNATTPIQVSVPAVELTVTPVSASGQPLTSEATVNVTCSGVPIASGVGAQTVVVPIPSSGSITCTITGYSYGKSASTTVTLTSSEAGQTITRTLTIPVSGVKIPGVGFVPVSTFILLAVVIIIVIILIVILLIEYSNWRRRRLAGLLGPPK